MKPRPFDHRSGRPLRLTARARDHRNDHHADGAAGRLRGSRHGHHAAPLHVRSLDRVHVMLLASAWLPIDAQLSHPMTE